MFFKYTFSTIIAMIFAFIVLIFIAVFYYDFHQFEKQQQQLSLTQIDKTIEGILELNSELRIEISDLLIKHRDLFSEFFQKPEKEELIDEIHRILKESNEYYYTFIVADHSGQISTDHFFEKVGRLCRQDIKNFAFNEKMTWFLIHPGIDMYHFDIIIPWINGDEKKILLISYKVDPLTDILQQNEKPGHQQLIVRTDKLNLIELSSSGSRDIKDTPFYLLSQANQYSKPIKGTYWAVYDQFSIPLFQFYIKNRFAIDLL